MEFINKYGALVEFIANLGLAVYFLKAFLRKIKKKRTKKKTEDITSDLWLF